MPQFDLANATLNNSFIDNVMYPDEGFVPYIYDDKYPLIVSETLVNSLGVGSDLYDSTNNAKGVYYHHEDPYNETQFTSGSKLYKIRDNYRSSNTGISVLEYLTILLFMELLMYIDCRYKATIIHMVCLLTNSFLLFIQMVLK